MARKRRFIRGEGFEVRASGAFLLGFNDARARTNPSNINYDPSFEPTAKYAKRFIHTFSDPKHQIPQWVQGAKTYLKQFK